MSTPLHPAVELAERWQCAHVVLTSSARAALYLAQRALRVQAAPVGVPALTCAAVPAAVEWAGNHPVALEMDPLDFAPLPPTQPLAALIVPHPYGTMLSAQRLRALRATCSILIEDAAQTWRLHDAPARPASGSLCTVLSFGTGKVVDCGGGGALLTNDAALAAAAHHLIAAQPGLGMRPATLQLLELALPHSDGWMIARQERAALYAEALASSWQGPQLHCLAYGADAAPWVYTMVAPTLRRWLTEHRTTALWGVPLWHFYPPIAAPGVTPAMRALATGIVNLPVSPRLATAAMLAWSERLGESGLLTGKGCGGEGERLC